MEKKVMTKEEFKLRWESSDDGGGITYEDIADCAVSWGLYQRPKIHPINQVHFEVLKAAQTNDYMNYSLSDEEDEED